MHELLTLIQQHMTAAGLGSGVLFVALVSCLPVDRPKTLDQWYAYIRESLQTAIPAARHPVNPTEPETPAQPKQ